MFHAIDGSRVEPGFNVEESVLEREISSPATRMKTIFAWRFPDRALFAAKVVRLVDRFEELAIPLFRFPPASRASGRSPLPGRRALRRIPAP